MDAEDIATYLDWKATVTKVQCISSLKTAYKNLQSLYRDKMGGLQVRSDINTAVHLVSLAFIFFTSEGTNNQNST